MPYPSEQYPELKGTVGPKEWKRISEYVDEAYHQGDTPAQYDCSSWEQLVSALCAYENHIPQTGFGALYEDYKLYVEVVEA